MTAYQEYLTRLSRINALDYQDAGTQQHLLAVAAPLDDLALKTRTVMLSRLAAFAPESLLLLIGAERGLRRYPGEPLETYRARVIGAWDFWRLAGTLRGLVLVLEQAGWRARVIEHFRDPDQEHWAEFSVVITPIQPLVIDSRWGKTGERWGRQSFWGFRLDALPFAAVLELIRELKPAHARLRRLLFSRGNHVWGGQDRWGSYQEYAELHPWGSPWGELGVIFKTDAMTFNTELNPWGSPWGEPSVLVKRTQPAGTEIKWGDNRHEVIYEMEGAEPYAERD